jgi:hypothetical protein
MKIFQTVVCLLVVAWLALLAFLVHGPEQQDTKRCAEALVTVGIGAECASTVGCVFTMTDLERLRDAQANKQNYCPQLGPGQEAANQ